MLNIKRLLKMLLWLLHNSVLNVIGDFMSNLLSDKNLKSYFTVAGGTAEEYIELAIDLNKELIKHPAATFYARVKGSSMIDAGIADGDLLIIDKALEPKDGDIAVCFIDGEFTLKRLALKEDGIYLMPANAEFKPIRITEENDFLVWGMLAYIVHKPR